LQKPEGFRAKASEGDVVALYFEASAIKAPQALLVEPEILRLSRLVGRS